MHKLIAGLALFALASAGVLLTGAEPAPLDRREAARKLMADGNWRDAYEQFRILLLDKKTDPRHAADDLKSSATCLQQLGRADEADALRHDAIEAHAGQWRVLQAAAESLMNGPHHGYLVAGEFSRGDKRGGGNYVSSFERDRAQALAWMQEALQLVVFDANAKPHAEVPLQLAGILMQGRNGGEAWRLQALTDLKELPDYEPGHRFGIWRGGWNAGGARGAPVDADGQPVFYEVPQSWDAAQNDGERWRWALAQAAQGSDEFRRRATLQRANFLHAQFGVQTMGNLAEPAGHSAEGEAKKDSPFAVQTLAETETIAKLATGVKRFALPEEHNFIRLYQQVAEDDHSDEGRQALEALASLFENRRQYDKAADSWRKAIKDYGPGDDKARQKRLEQIVGNWGRFEPLSTQPAGQEATFEYRFRNGHTVRFEAHALKMEQLLDDVKAYLRSSPAQLDWNRMNIDNIGYELVQKKQSKYLGERVAQWEAELDPPAGHLDGRITVHAPLKKAGAYLVTARMQDGNTSRIVVWLEETAIVRKMLDKAGWYFVADATTGRPVAGAELEFFGWQQRHLGGNRFQVQTTTFRQAANDDGEVITSQRNVPNNYQWLVTARTPGGRFSHLGFSHVWYGQNHEAEYNQTKVLAITDRPVYRPDQTVKFKFWVRHASYTEGDVSRFADQSFTVRITDPKGNTVQEKNYQTDQYGGFDGDYVLPDDAPLGQYGLAIVDHPQIGGGGSFRVEEYKKPEYEVKVSAPTEPVMLGETVTATIKAKYYFGAPVTHATVRYKVQRTEQTGTWYPPGPWDWFYGRGYGWLGVDRAWYPGWQRWGCIRPLPSWWHVPHNPPELVLENEVPIGPDGTVKVEIDTRLAQALHGDRNHKYQITAEVVDRSRRTIVGTGEVLVANEPFQVVAWVDRGFYRTGDTIAARFQTQTLDHQPVQGDGTLTLYRVSYDDQGQPDEKAVETWDLDTDEQGEAAMKIEAARPGQYRLSYKVTDKQGHAIEGGYLFMVLGEGLDSKQYRFNDLELIVERREYARGETCRVLINTERPDSTVLLFVRPANGVYPRPIVLHLKGKSATYDIAVQQSDMPNFFIEALTVTGADVATETREIVVPPEQRIVNVAVRPSQTEYQPGKEAKVRLKLTDMDGNAVTGSAVLTVYDKSIEYISGGSNVPDIREFFWKWQRHHHPSTQSNLERQFDNLIAPNETPMSDLGAFGWIATDAIPPKGAVAKQAFSRVRGMGMMRGVGGMAEAAGAMPAPMAAPADGPEALEAFPARGTVLGITFEDQGIAGGKAAPQMAQATVRKAFADAAYWAAALTPDKNGEVEVSFKLPENLTTWTLRTWSMGHGTRVGQGQAEIVTTKNLLVRLQAPRFFTETDEVVLSCLVHNYLDEEKEATVSLELEGAELQLTDDLKKGPAPADKDWELFGTTSLQTVKVPAGGEVRVEWRVTAVQSGDGVVRVKALTDEESDAMQMTFPVLVHGLLKTESFTGTVRQNEQAGSVSLSVPEQRRVNETWLEVRFSPTLAGAMVDALPYLVSYPYGCTEQTLNRFLPTVVTQNILKRMNLNLAAIRDKRTNLNAQEVGDARQRAGQWQRHKDQNPVFDEAEVARMAADGLQRLTDMQLADGGWGWFSGWGSHSDAHTTALVVHGLLLARANGTELDAGLLDRGIHWLRTYQAQQVEWLRNADAKKKDVHTKSHADNLDAFIYMVLAEAEQAAEPATPDAAGKGAKPQAIQVRPTLPAIPRGVAVRPTGAPAAAAAEPSDAGRAMNDYLYRDRTQLSVYAKAMYGLALHQRGEHERLAMIVRNIEQFLVQDAENETAYLKLPNENFWWYWYGNDVEAHAYYLKLLARTAPQSVTAQRLVKYLLNNRKHAAYWHSTRDTAIAIEALAEYLRASGEERPNLTVEVWLDDQKHKEVTITPETLFTFDNSFVLEGDAVTAGPHRLELRKQGAGPLYWNAYLTYFSLEDHITAAGLEIKVGRRYFKLVPQEKTAKVEGSRGQAVEQRVEKYDRVELNDLSTLQSGDLVEIELTIDSRNDYEHLMFIDHKAAGFEPVEIQSGYTGNGLGAYVEYRDETVNFFVRSLARGKHSLSYRLRAETPGRFSALPTVGTGMYAPELKGNSDEIKLVIEDKPD